MRRGRPRIWFAASLCLIAATAVRAEPRPSTGEQQPAEVPGLLAAFSASIPGGPEARRVVPDLVGRWAPGGPDPRVPPRDLLARWTGLLLIQSPGPHRFFARTDGAVVLRVDGRDVLRGTGDTQGADPISLGAGFATIALEYRQGHGQSRLAIDWEGPGFAREPVPARLLFHEWGADDHADRFEEGRRLADRLGCANCHTVLDLPRHPDLGPPLDDAGRAIDPRWLGAWLADPTAVRNRTRMPALGGGFSPAEVADLVGFLGSIAGTEKVGAEIRMALNVASPERGRALFRSVGCLACHARGTTIEGDRAAPDLADLGSKRHPEWVASYLEHPRGGKGVSRHRADLRLDADESAHLAAYLVSAPPGPLPGEGPAGGNPARGRMLADRARCASCHAIPGLEALPSDLPLNPDSDPDGGCLASGRAGPLVPRFALNDDERRALRAFIAGLPRSPSETSLAARAEDAVRRLNCLGCHARDGRGGTELGSRVAALLPDDPGLQALKGTLTPPDLTAVGDKLRPAYLAQAVRGTAPTARPWLSVRMPVFAFRRDEADAIVGLFRDHDRMGPEAEARGEAHPPDRATLDTAERLIGQGGFGCLSCHVLAGKVPPGGEPETLGPDLALAHSRMTGRYFHRWVSNPQRIIPGTPMPQFVQPIATVGGTLDSQLASIWELLGSPRLGEVAASGTRAVLKREGDRARVVRDMVLVPGAPGTMYTPRGLAIGLDNGHSLLFDTDRLTWLAWWRGGFVSRTKSGRLWEWHPEGERLWTTPSRGAPIVFLRDGRIVPPTEVRERFGAFVEVDFEGKGVALAYRLNGPGGVAVTVTERIRPTESGWERTVAVENVPDRVLPAVVERIPAWTWTVGESSVTLRTSGTASDAPTIPAEPTIRVLPMTRSDGGRFTAKIWLSVEPRR